MCRTVFCGELAPQLTASAGNLKQANTLFTPVKHIKLNQVLIK